LTTAVFLVFLTLEATEILLFAGGFANSTGLVKAGGIVGVITAVVAWYTSAAGISNGMTGGKLRFPVGPALIR
jgi:succinate-acetate transporter protein